MERLLNMSKFESTSIDGYQIEYEKKDNIFSAHKGPITYAKSSLSNLQIRYVEHVIKKKGLSNYINILPDGTLELVTFFEYPGGSTKIGSIILSKVEKIKSDNLSEWNIDGYKIEYNSTRKTIDVFRENHLLYTKKELKADEIHYIDNILGMDDCSNSVYINKDGSFKIITHYEYPSGKILLGELIIGKINDNNQINGNIDESTEDNKEILATNAWKLDFEMSNISCSETDVKNKLFNLKLGYIIFENKSLTGELYCFNQTFLG